MFCLRNRLWLCIVYINSASRATPMSLMRTGRRQMPISSKSTKNNYAYKRSVSIMFERVIVVLNLPIYLLLGESLLIIGVIDDFWDWDTLTENATLAFFYWTFVINLFDCAVCYLLNSLVELFVNLSDKNDVFSHALNFWFPTLLQPDATTSCLFIAIELTTYRDLSSFCSLQTRRHLPTCTACTNYTKSWPVSQTKLRLCEHPA